MIGLVLVTHGQLAREFIDAMEHVVGPQSHVAGICIGPDDDMEQRRREIIQSVSEVDDGDLPLPGAQDRGAGDREHLRREARPEEHGRVHPGAQAPVRVVHA